ncbi:MAG TPA: glycerol-3-phosphate acyltransferase [Chloroflexota bacterium]|nr:glycerol-3-phosphate acyltransferase [Chloroflexota bacterium]
MALQNLAQLAASVALGYLLGSVPFAVLVEYWKGVDLRRFGSGNVGASNAYVVAGKTAGVLVLLGDAAKGILSVFLAGSINGGSHMAMAAAGVGAVVGHDWSMFLRLKGGKGTATTVGVILALDWRILAVAVVVYFTLLAVTRLIVISSLITVAAIPAFMMIRPWFVPGVGPEPLAFVYAAIVLAALGYLRHWEHVERFVQGREPKAGDMAREMRKAADNHSQYGS